MMAQACRVLSIAGAIAPSCISLDSLAQTGATKPPDRASAGSTGDFSTAPPATPTPPPAAETSEPAPVQSPPAQVPPTYPPPAQVTPQPAYWTRPDPRPGPSYAGKAAEPEQSEWHPSHPGVIVSVERAFGFYFSTGSREGLGQRPVAGSSADSDLSGTTANVLGGGPMGSFNPFSAPLVAVHGAVGGFTFGGGIGYQADTQKSGLLTTDLNALTVAPRVGYVVDLGSAVSVWIRAGVAYSSQTTERSWECQPGATSCTQQSLKQTSSLFDLSLDPMFVFSPIPHLGVLLGPTIDVALSGTQNDGPITTFTDPNSPPLSPERELRLSSFGVAAGVALFF